MIFTKQIGRNNVDSLVRALGRQYRRDQKLKGIFVIKSTVSIGVGLFETLDYFSGSLL